MKIAVATKGTDLDSDVDLRFGRCQNFIYVDTRTMEYKCGLNEGFYLSENAGIKAAQTVIEKEVEAVVAGFIGSKALKVLTAAKIKRYIGARGTIRNAVEEMECGKLKEMDDLNIRNRFDMKIIRGGDG